MPVFFSRLKTITMSLPADQFSSGLVANLYENLAVVNFLPASPMLASSADTGHQH